MADIINSQMANAPKDLSKRRHVISGQGSVAKPPTAGLRNTFTATNHATLGKTRSISKTRGAAAAASDSSSSSHGIKKKGSLLGLRGKPTTRGSPAIKGAAQKISSNFINFVLCCISKLLLFL